MLVDPRDRATKGREPCEDIAVAQLRQLEQRRPSVVRVRPSLDVTPRLQAPKIAGQRCRRHPQQVRKLRRGDRLEGTDRTRDGEPVRIQLLPPHGAIDEIVRELAQDEEPEEDIAAA
jgi:hypothetical protein